MLLVGLYRLDLKELYIFYLSYILSISFALEVYPGYILSILIFIEP